MPALPTASTIRPDRFGILILTLLFMGAACLYTWAPASFPTRWITREPASLYAELAEAHLHGQLSLQRQPDPHLLALNDPYDPAQNAPFRVNDVSLYAGQYYLYHGVSPVLVLYTPYRAVTGRHLTDSTAALVFCLGGAAVSLMLLVAFAHSLPSPPSRLVLAFGGLVAVLANGYHFVLRGPGIHHVAIAAAQFFLLLAVWLTLRALASSRTAGWLAAAATAYGLAIAARPNYVFGAIAMLVPLFWLWRREGRRITPGWLRCASAIALPLVLAVGGILLHNFLRFGHPLEFGQRFQLGAWDQRALGVFGLNNLWVNAWHYLLDPGALSADFPFITAPSWQAVGVLVHTPFVWLSLGAIIVIGRTTAASRTAAGTLTLILLCNLGFLLFLPSGNDKAVLTSANARYAYDFIPLFVLLAALGALTMDAHLARRTRLQRSWRVLVCLLAFVSLLGNLSLDLQHFPPESYRQVTQNLNRPLQSVRRWLGTVYGPVRFQVTFPTDRFNVYEPLLATGTREGSDLLYVHYDSPETVRFGLVGTTMRGPMSPPIPVTYGVPHSVEVAMGSLYPPIGHPALAPFSEAAIAAFKRTLRITLDGKLVYEVPAHFFPAKSRQVYLGKNPHLEGYSAPSFTGQLDKVSRPPIAAPPLAAIPEIRYGPVRLTFRFPKGINIRSEPLLVTGLPQAGDFIFISYAGTRAFVIGYDHWGTPGRLSKTLFTTPQVEQVLEVTMGSLYPPRGHVFWKDFEAAEIERLKRLVQVRLNGVVVLEHEQEAYESSPYDVRVGRNILGGSTCEYEFTGELIKAERLPPPGR